VGLYVLLFQLTVVIYRRIKSESDKLPGTMPLRSCRVTVKDMEGVTHTAEVTASSLFEAVALGIAAIRGNEWAGEIAEGLNTVQVSVTEVPVTHTVKVGDFNKWLNRTGGSPREIVDRSRFRQILGVSEDQKL
jgi:hypothetical protein